MSKAYYDLKDDWTERNYLMIQHTHDLAKETPHHPIDYCRCPQPLPTCGGQSRAGSGAKSILGHRWSARGEKLGQGMQVGWENTCATSSAHNGTTFKVETWDKNVFKLFCWLCWTLYNQDNSRSFCLKIPMPVHVLSNQSGTFRNGMFIEHHRFPECVKPNGGHQGKTGRNYKQ